MENFQRFILLFLITWLSQGCDSEVSIDLNSESKGVTPFATLNVEDRFSGLNSNTYSSQVNIEITGDSHVLEYCLMDQDSSLANPFLPEANDSCFTNVEPTSYNLASLGNRTLFLFLKDKNQIVLSQILKHPIIYSLNVAPVLTVDNTLTQINTPVIIDLLANDTDSEGDSLAVIAVGSALNGTPVLNEDGTVTFTPDPAFVGEASFEYTVEDSRGGSAIGKSYVVIPNAFTWIGNGGDSNWNNATNWCGSILSGVCQGDGVVPGTSDIAVFNSSCLNCNVTIDASISVDGINISEGYTGTITQATGQTITVGDLDWIQDGGSFVGGDSLILINLGEFILNNGSFISTTSDLKLIDAKGGYGTHDYFTISKTGLFTHNNGRVWFHLRSSNHPKHSIKITGVNNFYDVLVKRDGGSTDDVMLSTETTPDKVLIERHLNLENISIKGAWEVQGDIYYGPQYGTYQGTQDASITFSGSNNQSINVDGATGFSKGDVVINKTSGSITLITDVLLSTTGQGLSFQSNTTFNMAGFSLDVNAGLDLANSSILNRGGGVLSYGTWNGQGTINP